MRETSNRMTGSNARKTRLERLFDELSEAAKRCGIEVRQERLLREIGYRARGGVCRIRNQDLAILDREQSVDEQIEVLVEALRERDLETLYLSPEARKAVDKSAEQA